MVIKLSLENLPKSYNKTRQLDIICSKAYITSHRHRIAAVNSPKKTSLFVVSPNQ